MRRFTIVWLTGCWLGFASLVYAGIGTNGAAFLDIPVGGGPAAMGAAYTALANDAYAATWNPGGLGQLESSQFSGQHVDYLDTLHYEYLSFAIPSKLGGFGGSVQYLGSGDINATGVSGASIGTFSSYYASYNLSYGRSLNEKLSLGLTGKMISAKIDDVSASAYAADLGAMYKASSKTTLAATLTNLGSQLKFLSEGDDLPMAVHLAGSFRPKPWGLFASEVIFSKDGFEGFHLGGEWRPLGALALRTGYRTEVHKELSALSGFSTGVGLLLWGQELSYAWLPYGDLGSTHYISLLVRLGETDRANKNLIQYQHIKAHRTADGKEEANPEVDQLMQLLNESNLIRVGKSE